MNRNLIKTFMSKKKNVNPCSPPCTTLKRAGPATEARVVSRAYTRGTRETVSRAWTFAGPDPFPRASALARLSARSKYTHTLRYFQVTTARHSESISETRDKKFCPDCGFKNRFARTCPDKETRMDTFLSRQKLGRVIK